MATIGQRVPVGSNAPATGQYKHTVCPNTIIINKDEKVPPCGRGACPNKGADWKFAKVHT